MTCTCVCGAGIQVAGVVVGDFIVAVSDVNVKWARHEQVVRMIRDSGLSVRLSLVTPVDRNFIDPTATLSYGVSSRDRQEVSSVDWEETERRSSLEDSASHNASQRVASQHAIQQPRTRVDTPTLSRYLGFRRKRNKNS